MTRHRRAVRVVVRNSENRILLFLSHFGPNSGLEPAWVFPGGGIEGQETELEAAIRELREETGMVVGNQDLSAELHRLQHDMPYRENFDTGEAVFFELLVQDAFEPDSTNWTEDEVRDNLEHRWWSLSEILDHQPWIEPAGSLEFLMRHLGQADW